MSDIHLHRGGFSFAALVCLCSLQSTANISVLEDEDVSVVGAQMDFCPESKEEQHFSYDRAILCREMTVEAKPSHMSTLQTSEDQSTSGFSHFVPP